MIHLSEPAYIVGCIEVQVVDRMQRGKHRFEMRLHSFFVLLLLGLIMSQADVKNGMKSSFDDIDVDDVDDFPY